MDSKPHIKALWVVVVAWLVSSAGCAASGTTRHEFPLFSISVPNGWTHVVYGPNDRHAGRHGFGGPGVRFEGPSGEYLDIAPDLGIDGPDADDWWKGTGKPDGSVAVEGRETLCVKVPPAPPEAAPGEPGLSLPECLAGDGYLDAEVSFTTRGHSYVVTFGNDKRERAEDLKPFKAILATFKAK
jgi:hypothetical protein